MMSWSNEYQSCLVLSEAGSDSNVVPGGEALLCIPSAILRHLPHSHNNNGESQERSELSFLPVLLVCKVSV